MGLHHRSILGLLPLILILPSVVADAKPYISTSTDYNTECKKCPHSLCANKIAYGYDDALNATCWTRGTKIAGNNLWLKTDAECYVTQYDVKEYTGDYTKDLDYCGRGSESEKLTEEDARLQYKTECRICPEITCDVAAYLPEDTDVTLTCHTKGQLVIDDPVWLKTRNNCYVAEIGLYHKPDVTYLEDCGPIPFLEIEWHNNGNITSDVDKRNPESLPVPIEQAPSYLINVTVGEDHAYCRHCPKEKCRIEQSYAFNKEVWLQCLIDMNGTWWSETTDFCYVKNSDFWESPEGDYYSMPLCSYFEDGDD